jgi:hypothetical protein
MARALDADAGCVDREPAAGERDGARLSERRFVAVLDRVA